MPDIMCSFEYAAYDYNFDFSVDEHNVYKSEKTRKAFFWYQKVSFMVKRHKAKCTQ